MTYGKLVGRVVETLEARPGLDGVAVQGYEDPKDLLKDSFPAITVTTATGPFHLPGGPGSSLDGYPFVPTVELLITVSVSADHQEQAKAELFKLSAEIMSEFSENHTLTVPGTSEDPLAVRSVLSRASENQGARGGLAQSSAFSLTVQEDAQAWLTVGDYRPLPVLSMGPQRTAKRLIPHYDREFDLSGYSHTGRTFERNFEVEYSDSLRDFLDDIVKGHDEVPVKITRKDGSERSYSAELAAYTEGLPSTGSIETMRISFLEN